MAIKVFTIYDTILTAKVIINNHFRLKSSFQLRRSVSLSIQAPGGKPSP